MKTEVKKQKAKVGVAGSFFNQLMSNNSSIPEIGKGATIMHYTDRTVVEVIEVSKDGKTVTLESVNPAPGKVKPYDGYCGGEASDYIPTGNKFKIVWRNGAWRNISRSIVFTDDFLAKATTFATALSLSEEQREEIYQGQPYPQKIVEGITREKFSYPVIKILFGTRQYYYDPSF